MGNNDPLRGPISSGSGGGDVDVDAAGMGGDSEEGWAMMADTNTQERTGEVDGSNR
jgi:hypothetical protein